MLLTLVVCKKQTVGVRDVIDINVETDSTYRVQILDEVVCVLLRINILEKRTNSLPSSAMDKQ